MFSPCASHQGIAPGISEELASGTVFGRLRSVDGHTRYRLLRETPQPCNHWPQPFSDGSTIALCTRIGHERLPFCSGCLTGNSRNSRLLVSQETSSEPLQERNLKSATLVET